MKYFQLTKDLHFVQKLDWIIANTAPIEVDASEGEDSTIDQEEEEMTRQAADSMVISDSDIDDSSESESDSEVEIDRSTSSNSPKYKIKPEGSSMKK